MRMLVSSAVLVCVAVAVIFADPHRDLRGWRGRPATEGIVFGLTKKEGAPGRWAAFWTSGRLKTLAT